ncbi:RNA pseudouridine synthase [Candidatus Dojkabacteria bacterium]|nr:RNA pseudouridine synthase [Candidatus Dojkabacteria bacterium]
MKIWETPKYIVVDKPYGLPTTYKNEQDTGDCLVKRIIKLYPKLLSVKGYKEREGGLLYRLDNETTGVVLFAKSNENFNEFIALSQEGEIFKRYIAHTEFGINQCKGKNFDKMDSIFFKPREVLGEYYPLAFNVSAKDVELSDTEYKKVDIPIGHSKKSMKRMIPVIDSISKSRLRNINKVVSYIRDINLNTFDVLIQKGCRHQIRVHLATIGYPIIGDNLYNKENKNVIKPKMMLRCTSVFSTGNTH